MSFTFSISSQQFLFDYTKNIYQIMSELNKLLHKDVFGVNSFFIDRVKIVFYRFIKKENNYGIIQ